MFKPSKVYPIEELEELLKEGNDGIFVLTGDNNSNQRAFELSDKYGYINATTAWLNVSQLLKGRKYTETLHSKSLTKIKVRKGIVEVQKEVAPQ